MPKKNDLFNNHAGDDDILGDAYEYLMRHFATESGKSKGQFYTPSVVRKDIKNLHLGVYPPAGRIRVAAPLRVNDEGVRLFTISKLGWIQRQQAKFAGQERQSEREFVSGESHYYQGNRYLLNIVYRKGTPAVMLRNNKMLDIFVRTGRACAWADGVVPAAAQGGDRATDREVGGDYRRASCRVGCEADEDALGNMQYRGATHLAES